MATTEVTRSYLEMLHPGDLTGSASTLPAGARLDRVSRCPISFHRYLYREVGRNYHWRDRLTWTDEQERDWINDPRLSLHVLYQDGSPAGYFELRREAEGSVEIAYFGLLPEFIGKGLGKVLLTMAVTEAWTAGARRVWLHTCTLDDPAALPNYLKRGFRKYQEERYTIEG